MKRLSPCLLVLLPVCVHAIEAVPIGVPFEITHEKFNFRGELAISMTGPRSKIKTAWNGTARNESADNLFRVTFCVKAFDTANAQIKPGGNECVLTLWANDWQPGTSVSYKGKHNIKLDDDKALIAVSKYTVNVAEVLETAPNLRTLNAACALVWPQALRVFADKRFRPTVMDKDSFTAAYTYDGGVYTKFGDVLAMLRGFTAANMKFLGPAWNSFRIDAASLYLREESSSSCTAEIKMSFAGYGKPFLGTYGWYDVGTNFAYEKMLLDDLGLRSAKAAKIDMDRAISQIPNQTRLAEVHVASSPRAALQEPVSSGKPTLVLTSEPSGAEIEINGEFIGNTPTTIATKDGSVTLRMKKAGFQTWERTLNLNPGDRRTINSQLMRPEDMTVIRTKLP